MRGTRVENAVILHRKTKRMNWISLIGAGAAFLKMQKAKETYEKAVDRKECLQAAIQTYIKQRDDQLDAALNDTQYVNQNEGLSGVLATTILRVGNLADARLFSRAQVTVVLSNTSDKDYTIYRAEAAVRVFGKVIGISTAQKRNTNQVLKSGETIEIELPGGKAQFDRAVKNAICEAQGKKLITSCGRVQMNGIETADIAFTYKPKNGAGSRLRARYVDVDGTLAYMMENYYPSEA